MVLVHTLLAPMQMTLWSYFQGVICCTTETSSDEIKLAEISPDGCAQPVLVGQGGREKNYYSPCMERCCSDTNNGTAEVDVVPAEPVVGLRSGAAPNSSPPNATYPEAISTMVYPDAAGPLPIPGPAQEAEETMSYARTQEQRGSAGSSPIVPPITGLGDLSRLTADLSSRDRGDIEVELKREGPQWSNLGMLVSPNAANPDNLNIDEIDEASLLGEWNATRMRPQQVWPGDVIVAVNGRTGRELIREIQQTSAEGSQVKLLINRGSQMSGSDRRVR